MDFGFTLNAEPLVLDDEIREKLKVHFIAKHALSGGKFHEEDGSHAVYHNEIRLILESLFQNVSVSNSYTSLYDEPEWDYLFSLFNRGGFRNSEVFASIFGEYHGVPYLGAPPTIRALTDDKNYSKYMVNDLGVPTPKWGFLRDSDPIGDRSDFPEGRLIAKPNASSASWGINLDADWDSMKDHIRELQDLKHDVIVEELIPGFDITVPIIGADRAWVLPATKLVTSSPDSVPTYEEKRGFASGYECAIYDAYSEYPDILKYTEILTKAIWPFDYGRIDYRINPESGQVYFLEYNVCGNLSAEKSVAQGAFAAGLTHTQLVETIICSSLTRQRVTV